VVKSWLLCTGTSQCFPIIFFHTWLETFKYL